VFLECTRAELCGTPTFHYAMQHIGWIIVFSLLCKCSIGIKRPDPCRNMSLKHPPGLQTALQIRGGSTTSFLQNASEATSFRYQNGLDVSPEAEILNGTNILGQDRTDPNTTLLVTKRDGSKVPFDTAKLRQRLERLVDNADAIDIGMLAYTIQRGLYDGVSTDELDVLAAETSASMATQHPVYGTLAARILISRNRKMTPDSYSQAVRRLSEGSTPSFLHSDLLDIVQRRGVEIDAYVRSKPMMEMTYFGFKTLERAYLLREETGHGSFGAVVERPEYLMMRVALGIHCCTTPENFPDGKMPDGGLTEDAKLAAAFETYDHLVGGYFTHASPTLFHAGTKHPQLSSCFLVRMSEDSIRGIYDTLKQCALISKSAGGIGLSVHNIRARGTMIKGTRGTSNGLVPMLRVFDVTSRYVDQGGGKRPGAFAIYLEPWHADIFDVLNLKKNHGKEEHRARDLFFGLWIPDLFMQRVEEDGVWSLMCPDQCKGLADCSGDEFEKLYTLYETSNKFVRQVRARELWSAIIESQIETGTPYMLYKDACNKKSNQKNLGTIQCSNLCTEIIQYTDKNEVAVCNLASICLPKYVVSDRGALGSVNQESDRAYFDHGALHRAVKIITRNLNKIIDLNSYPVDEARFSNFRHRPIGIGVAGLADAFLRLGLPFTSSAAKQLNEAIFETIYHAALEASAELAEDHGSYETFPGSPTSEGKLQFDLWNVSSDELPSVIYQKTASEASLVKQTYQFSEEASTRSTGYGWDLLRHKIRTTGLRNSLLVAPMPTASTSQILGVNECFEPFSSNLYIRRVKAGEFIMANPHLLQDLTDRGLWTPSLRNRLMRDNGSVRNIPEIPDRLKELYKTVWEIKMKDIIEMAADRGKFIDQSQSLNLFMADPSFDKVTAMHFHAWKKGMKTGMYYLRTKPAVNAIQYTVDKGAPEPSVDATDICVSCQG
jgi:ribonucleoside-diphosphate reductase alpha subunit